MQHDSAPRSRIIRCANSSSLQKVHPNLGPSDACLCTSATNCPAGLICSISVGVRYSITLRFCCTRTRVADDFIAHGRTSSDGIIR